MGQRFPFRPLTVAYNGTWATRLADKGYESVNLQLHSPYYTSFIYSSTDVTILTTVTLVSTN